MSFSPFPQEDALILEPSHLSLQPVATSSTLASAPIMSLEAVTALLLGTAAEISGSEMEADAHFADHHFDSLAAVELATSIGKSVGLTLPSESFSCSEGTSARAEEVSE